MHYTIFLPGQPDIVLPLFGTDHKPILEASTESEFLKVPSNIIAITELSSTRKICRPTTSHLMMQQLELQKP